MSEEARALLARPLTLRGLRHDDERGRLLHALQANILHSHVRTHLRLLVLRIEGPYAARRGLADVARSMKTAARQFDELHAYRTTGQPAPPTSASRSRRAATSGSTCRSTAGRPTPPSAKASRDAISATRRPCTGRRRTATASTR